MRAVEIISTVDKKIKQKNYLVSGKYPIIDQGQDFIGGYTNERENLIDSEFPVIVFGDHTRIVKLLNDRFAPGADGIKIIRPIEIFNPILFFYFTKYLSIKLPDKRYSRHFQFLKKSKIPLPPLNEQNRIVEKIEELFSKLDKAKEELQKVREQLKIYRQSVLKAAFEGKLTEEWRKNHNNDFHELKDLFSKIAKEVFANNGKKSNMRKNNNFGEDTKYFSPIPKKWTWVKIRNISYDIQYGYTKSASKNPTGCKFLRITDIQNNEVAWEEVPYCNINHKDKKKYLLEEGDILFARTGATVGKSYLIKRGSPESIFASYLIRLKLSLFVNKLYVYYFFKSPLYWKQIKAGQVGTGQPNFNGTKLGNLLIPVCIIKEQEQIVQKIESRLSVCDKIEESVESGLIKIEHLRQSILKKAFEGKLVPQDPDDLPAEELLKQIKIEKEKIQNNSKKKVKR